jgi:hypothetical protein
MLRGRNGHFLKERETSANGVEVKFSLESKVIEFSLDAETLQLKKSKKASKDMVFGICVKTCKMGLKALPRRALRN